MGISTAERIVARCFGTTAGYAGLVQMIDEAIESAKASHYRQGWKDAEEHYAEYDGKPKPADQPVDISDEEESAWQIINSELAKLNLIGKTRTDAADAIWERLRPFISEAVSVEKIARMTCEPAWEKLSPEVQKHKLELARDAIAAMGFTPIYTERESAQMEDLTNPLWQFAAWCKQNADYIASTPDWEKSLRDNAQAALSFSTLKRESTQPGQYTLRFDQHGFIDGIERDGYTVLHLMAGTERNQQEAPGIVGLLNSARAPVRESGFEIDLLRRAMHILGVLDNADMPGHDIWPEVLKLRGEYRRAFPISAGIEGEK